METTLASMVMVCEQQPGKTGKTVHHAPPPKGKPYKLEDLTDEQWQHLMEKYPWLFMKPAEPERSA